MIVTAFTRETLRSRRISRDWTREGFIRVSESGHPLWRFKRGGWYRNRILDVRIDPNGQELWIKTDVEAS